MKNVNFTKLMQKTHKTKQNKKGNNNNNNKKQQPKTLGREYSDMRSCYTISLKMSGCSTLTTTKNDRTSKKQSISNNNINNTHTGSTETVPEEGQILDLDKKFESSMINMLKELKKTMSQKLKESMRTLSH